MMLAHASWHAVRSWVTCHSRIMHLIYNSMLLVPVIVKLFEIHDSNYLFASSQIKHLGANT